MRLSGSWSAVSRLAIVTLGLAVTLGAGSLVHAQQAAPAAAPDPFKFTSDAMTVIWAVKSASTADFESVWGSIKTKLSASDKPDLKAMGDSLKIYKVDGPAADTVTYLLFADPASKTTYSPVPFLLYDSGLFERAAADALYKKLTDATAGNISPLSLTAVKAVAAAPAP